MLLGRVLASQERPHAKDEQSGHENVQWICDHTNRDMIKNKIIWGNMGVASLDYNMKK